MLTIKMSLPVENISNILDNASTMEEYKNIRESFNLKDNDIKSLVKREYNKKIDAIKEDEMKMDKKYGKRYLDHLYHLRNPESIYVLILCVWEDAEISTEIIGTKKQIIEYLKKETERLWISYVLDSDSDKEYKERENRMTEIQNEYEQLVNDEINCINENGYSQGISAIHLNEIRDKNSMYIIAKIK